MRADKRDQNLHEKSKNVMGSVSVYTARTARNKFYNRNTETLHGKRIILNKLSITAQKTNDL